MFYVLIVRLDVGFILAGIDGLYVDSSFRYAVG